MRKIIAVLMLTLSPLNALTAGQSDDAENMGHLAGVVLACGAYKPLYQFEEIISRYFSNTAPNQEAEKTQIELYARAKASTFSIFKDRKGECAQTIKEFTRMPIFNSELYSDGSLRLPDGKFLYPRGQKKLANGAEKIYPASK